MAPIHKFYSAWPWCRVGLPAEYAVSYQQDCIGLLLSGFDNFDFAWTRTIDKDSYRLLCCRGSTIATSHSSDYLRLHWLLSSESSTPLLASSPNSDLATMLAMFCEIYIGSQSLSEYYTRCASWCSTSSMEQRRHTWLAWSRASPISQVGVISVLPQRDCLTCLALELCLVLGLLRSLVQRPSSSADEPTAMFGHRASFGKWCNTNVVVFPPSADEPTAMFGHRASVGKWCNTDEVMFPPSADEPTAMFGHRASVGKWCNTDEAIFPPSAYEPRAIYRHPASVGGGEILDTASSRRNGQKVQYWTGIREYFARQNISGRARVCTI